MEKSPHYILAENSFLCTNISSGDFIFNICIKDFHLRQLVMCSDVLREFAFTNVLTLANYMCVKQTISFLKMGCQTFKQRIIYGLAVVNREIILQQISSIHAEKNIYGTLSTDFKNQM